MLLLKVGSLSQLLLDLLMQTADALIIRRCPDLAFLAWKDCVGAP